MVNIIQMTTNSLHQLFRALLFLLLTIPVYSCRSEATEPDPFQPSKPDTLYTYTNPLSHISGIGDPYVLQHNGKYYMYATSSGDGFKVWESENLVDWIEKGLALNRNSDGNIWGKGNFWAPEVKYFHGSFYMTYSAVGENDKMKIRIARSENPLGPFINWSAPFNNNDQFSYIDADLYLDADTAWLFYVKDCSENIVAGKHVSQIYVSRMKTDLKELDGSSKLILTPDQGWEGINSDWLWNEGPFVMKNNGTLYLFYSANVYSSADYSVGVAMAQSPFGEWIKYAGNPVLKKDISLNVSGPGHCMVTQSPDQSELFIVYHTHTYSDKPSGDRNMCIDRLQFKDGIPVVTGPTRTPQPLPSGVKFRVVP